MNSYERVNFAPVAPASGRAGQGSPTEPSQPGAEVPMQVLMAKQFPRDPAKARERMLAACQIVELAEEAFWEVETGRQTAAGLTIGAVCELAQIWSNLDFGLDEISRDDVNGRSEQLAYAWDLESNFRPSRRFFTPHVRDAQDGGYRVQDDRDVFGVVTSQGNRRLRGCILKVLPIWYVRAAETALKATLARSVNPGDEPFGDAVEWQVRAFIQTWDVTRAQLEDRASRPLSKWTVNDLVRLRVLSRSLSRGEVLAEEAFSARKVTADELPQAPAPAVEEFEEPAQAPPARARRAPAGAAKPSPRVRKTASGARKSTAQTQGDGGSQDATGAVDHASDAP